MTTPPAAWAAADPYATALRAGRGPLFLRRADGWLLPLDVERWCAHADRVDPEVPDRCEGAVLDVGCGPGRLVAALSARGRTVLGIDVSETAVHHAARLGAKLFLWARLGTPALLRHARRTRWSAVAHWTDGGRCFVALRSRSASSSAEPAKSTAVISSHRARKPSEDSPVPSR